MTGIYIHIPFCAKKCIYCDFYSIVSSRYQSDYMVVLQEELKQRCSVLPSGETVTVYIGGGTPSSVGTKLMQNFFEELTALCAKFHVKEFTIEVNPDDVTPELMALYKKAGCNRISMGVQSMVDAELDAIGRRHNAARAIEAVRIIRESGVRNLNLDVMFGLPGQTPESLEYTLQEILALHPEHISCYGLMYEEGTLIYRMRQDGRVSEVDDDTYINMYSIITRVLRNAGYEHYEISNYSLPGYNSRHNSAYWDGSPYIGIGASAHSFDGSGVRRGNYANVQKYISGFLAGVSYYDTEKETAAELHNDYIMTRLRTSNGISPENYEYRFGTNAAAELRFKLQPYIETGEVILARNGNYCLSESGFLNSDAVMRDLFVD